MEYKSIDYSQWGFSGQGKNILKFLTDSEKKIWDASLQYQDSRKGETGHGEVVTYFALKLLKYIRGDGDIVIPAAILHDVGWSQLTETERNLFYEEGDDNFGKKIWKRYEPILRARHQEQGVKLAENLLIQIDYFRQDISEIIEIISQHDTREEFLNDNDGIVRDADKLWRFTLPGFNIPTQIRKQNSLQYREFMLNKIKEEGFFYSDVSKKIAEIELSNIKN